MGNTLNMGKQVKGGYLLRYKSSWLWKSWREEWVVLYEDSTLAWFKDKGTRWPRGRLQVSEAPELMAVSEWTLQVPCRPRLPPDCQIGQLIAVGSRRKGGKVHWLLAQSENEVSDWMTAISNTLPPPPHVRIETDKNRTVAILQDGVTRNTNPNLVRCGHRDSTGSSGPLTVAGHSRDDYASGAMMGAALTWGHGWGWTTPLWNGHTSCGIYNAATVYATDTSATPYGHVNHNLAHDYSNGFEDVDYSMDCVADFGF